MEEIDNIILESLRHLNCKIDDDINSIKNFDPDMVVDAIVSCLEVIMPGVNMPHKLPPSMSLKLKLATTLSETIKELGFRGDIGYQTILYCNEVEVRRLLMFLIERVPRESDEDVPIQQTGYVHNLVKKIENKMKLSVQKSWIPSSLCHQGTRNCGNDFMKLSYNYTYPLTTENIKISSTQQNLSEDLKEYWIHCLEDVTKQCSSTNLISSLLFKDSDFTNICLTETVIHQNSFEKDAIDTDFAIIKTALPKKLNKIEENVAVVSNTNNNYESKLVMFAENLEQLHSNIIELKKDIKGDKLKLTELISEKEKEEEYLKDLLTKYKIKSRTLTVLSKEGNLEKLKNLIQNGNERFVELRYQWNEVQAPLLQQYQTLVNNTNAVETKQQEDQERLKNIKDKKEQLIDELKNKEKLENLLKQEREILSKNTRRSAYTRRILEIIGNIKKQNEEILKILNDTKNIQKKINSLNGQLDRSFTLSDELIFRNAKEDEMSRKAYKLLATLHNECGVIIQAITEMGITERESRNLQEQIDTEVGKATGASLERVTADLENVKKETASLLKQRHV